MFTYQQWKESALKEAGNSVLTSSIFNLLAGNDVLIQQIRDGLSEDEIIATWQEGLLEFKEKREQYLLY